MNIENIDPSKYIARLHCHNKVLCDYVKRILTNPEEEELTHIKKKFKEFEKELIQDRNFNYKKYHLFGINTWYEIYGDFIIYLRSLIKR